MSKSLKTIQTLCKIGRVLSKIAFVFSIIGAVGCLAGVICLAAGLMTTQVIAGINIHSILKAKIGISVGSMYVAMIGSVIMCVGSAVVAKFSELYFVHELAAGDPFTMEGAKEMQRLGILSICVPIAAIILANIVFAVFSVFMGNVVEPNLESDVSVGMGINFLILSVVLRYGAEQKQQQA